MAVNAPYGVLVWMFWCYITEACNYINFNQLNQQENLHILERKKDRKTKKGKNRIPDAMDQRKNERKNERKKEKKKEKRKEDREKKWKKERQKDRKTKKRETTEKKMQ